MSSMDLRQRKQKGQEEEGPERVRALIMASAEKVPAKFKPYVAHVANAVVLFLIVWDKAYPVLDRAFRLAVWAYKQLHEDLACALMGLLLCFFGGTFAVLISAFEAFRLTGWETTSQALGLLYEDYRAIKEADDKDNEVDADKDGVADVKQIPPSTLLARKAHLVLVSVKDPNRVNSALVGIASSCMSVVAVLRLEFARTVTLAMSIANVMKEGAERYINPILFQVVPKHYHQWVPLAVAYLCKSIAIAFAWYVQKVISATHSAIRGGLMFSRSVFDYANKRGYFKLKHDETNLDEIAGWVVAALGVYFQIRYGFSLPFPLNLLLLPFSLAEWALIWVVSDTDIKLN